MPEENAGAVEEEDNYYRIQRKFWSLFAPFYDFVVAPASKLRDRVAGLASVTEGAKVLDVATGTGKQAFAFARRGYDVTGVDLSEAMLKVARRKNRYKNLKLEVADATNLPFENGAFGISTISFAIHEMPLKVRERVLAEMVRVTSPDGTIIIVDFALPKNPIWRFLVYNLIKSFEGQHYVRFIKNDLKTSINRAGIAITGEFPILLGGVTIIKGSLA